MYYPIKVQAYDIQAQRTVQWTIEDHTSMEFVRDLKLSGKYTNINVKGMWY
jgi:hypothetical protein